MLPPFVLARTAGDYLGSHRYEPDRLMIALVVDKERFEVMHRYDLPPGFILHYGNGWEEVDGTIRFYACLCSCSD